MSGRNPWRSLTATMRMTEVCAAVEKYPSVDCLRDEQFVPRCQTLSASATRNATIGGGRCIFSSPFPLGPLANPPTSWPRPCSPSAGHPGRACPPPDAGRSGASAGPWSSTTSSSRQGAASTPSTTMSSQRERKPLRGAKAGRCTRASTLRRLARQALRGSSHGRVE
jgi:hypothetical protein